jgi:hypothetical protein
MCTVSNLDKSITVCDTSYFPNAHMRSSPHSSTICSTSSGRIGAGNSSLVDLKELFAVTLLDNYHSAPARAALMLFFNIATDNKSIATEYLCCRQITRFQDILARFLSRSLSLSIHHYDIPANIPPR